MGSLSAPTWPLAGAVLGKGSRQQIGAPGAARHSSTCCPGLCRRPDGQCEDKTPWRGDPRRGCKTWVLGGCLPTFQLPQSEEGTVGDGFVCPGVLTSCLCQPSGQWWGLGSEGCGQDHWRGKGWMGWGWVGEGRSATLGTSPLYGLAPPCPGTPKAWSRRGYGFSLRYQRCNHLGLQVFLGLTLTHIYMTEVLFCTPSNFPLCVLF